MAGRADPPRQPPSCFSPCLPLVSLLCHHAGSPSRFPPCHWYGWLTAWIYLSFHFMHSRLVGVLLCTSYRLSQLGKSDDLNFLLAFTVPTAFVLLAMRVWKSVGERYHLLRFTLYFFFPRRHTASIRIITSFERQASNTYPSQFRVEKSRYSQHRPRQKCRACRLWGQTLHVCLGCILQTWVSLCNVREKS